MVENTVGRERAPENGPVKSDLQAAREPTPRTIGTHMQMLWKGLTYESPEEHRRVCEEWLTTIIEDNKEFLTKGLDERTE